MLPGMWDQSCNYSPLAGKPLLGLSCIRKRPSFLKLSKTMRSMKIAPSCEEEACTISWRNNCIGAQVSKAGRWSLSRCIKGNTLWLSQHHSVSEATFESNLPPGAFLQKYFPSNFYSVLFTLSSALFGRTLRDCLQIHHSVSYRHFLEFWTGAQPFISPPSYPAADGLAVGIPTICLKKLYSGCSYSCLHSRSNCCFKVYYTTSITCVQTGASQLTQGAGYLQAQTAKLLKYCFKKALVVSSTLGCHWLPSIARHLESC